MSANDTDTKLLLKFADLTDSSVGGAGGGGHGTLTAVDNAAVSLTESDPYGGTAGVLVLDGDGDYIYDDHNADYNPGSGKLTIDWWTKVTQLEESTKYHYIIRKTDGTTDHWAVYLVDKGNETFELRFASYESGGHIGLAKSDAFSLEAGVWYHFAIIRGWGGQANDWAYVKDGVVISTETKSFTVTTTDDNMCIGGVPAAATFSVKGQLAQVRYVKGQARWTANFEVPSVPYPDAADVWMGRVNNVPNPSKVLQVANTTLYTGEVNQVPTYQ